MLNKFTKYNLPQLDLGVKLPEFKIEKKNTEKYNLPDNCTDYQFLLALCISGLESKIGSKNPRYKEYQKRMKIELDSFKELDFCSYLLITWDIVNHCRENNIAIGYGRGSAANSIVNYLTGITEIDSLKYNLYFERFLNKTRAKFEVKDGVKYYNGNLLFDIDLDIDHSNRDKLVEWFEEKYKGRIAKLPTVSTFVSKVLLKEVSKSLLDITEEQAKQISDSIPAQYGKNFDIDKSIKESEDFAKFAEKNPEIVSISRKLYELNKNLGIHASAWIISADNLNNIIPVQLSKDKNIVASYVMEDALELVIKIDLLSLKCTTLINRVCELVKINPLEININDDFIYKQLQDLKNPYGLFQIEGDCNYGVVKHVRPQTIEHLMAVVALARPGALQFVDSFSEFVETKEGQSLHPFFDDVLKETGFNCVYQEQAISMAHKLGFSLSEGETLRRIIGKKIPEEAKEWKEKVYNKVKDNNLDIKIGDILWKIIEDSASYQFNKGHSAAYAKMSAATIYLKFKYPKEFFLISLQLSKEEQNPVEEIRAIQKELQSFNIKLLGPHILNSDLDFKIEGDNIRFGLASIKGVADKTLEKLRNFKHQYSTKFDIFAAAEECGINIGVLTSLIHAGTMDDYLTETRSHTALEAQLWSLLTGKNEKQKVMDLGKEFNYDLINIIKDLSEIPEGLKKPFLKESRLKTIRKNFLPYKKIFKQNSKNEKLCSYFWEKTLIGYSYSFNLVDILRDKYPYIVTVAQAKGEADSVKLEFGGELSEYRAGISKNKNKYIKCRVYDGTDSANLMLMEKNFAINEQLNHGRKLENGDIVMIHGSRKGDIFFCESIVNQNALILTKTSQLKKDE